MSRSRVFAAALLVLALAVAGCGSSSSSSSSEGSSASKGGGTLVYGSNADPESLDPAVGMTNMAWRVIRNTYDTLVQDKLPTNEVEPAIAESWEDAGGGKRWTFKLREGLEFPDGTPLDADAVKLSYDRTLGIGQGPATFLSTVKAVNVVDPLTVEIELKGRDPYFLGKTTKIGIVNPAAVEEHKTAEDEWAKEWFNENTAASGPYQVASWEKGDRVVLERNPDYWRGWEDGKPDTVIIRTVPERSTARLLLERGELHMHHGLSLADVAALDGKEGLQVLEFDMNALSIFTLNVEKAPLDDVRVRRALQLAYDYAGTAEQIYAGYASLPNGPLPKTFEGWDDSLPEYEQNLDEARKLLAEAGHPDGGFTLNVQTIEGSGEQSQQAELLQAALQELGIKLSIRAAPFASMAETWSKPDTAEHMAALQMAAFTSDPVSYLAQSYHSRTAGGAYNWSYYKNPAVDKLIDDAAVEPDAEARVDLLKQAQQAIAEDAPTIIAAMPKHVEALSDRVQGYQFNPSEYFYVPRFYALTLQG